MTKAEFDEIKELMLGILRCRTQEHRALAINMVIAVLKSKVKPQGKGE